MISRVIRDSILQNIKYKRVNETEADSLYLDYREKLTLKQRRSREGMVYLYSAWSQAPGNKKILDQMIQLLEQGKDNMYYLRPLYKYLHKRYGDEAFVKNKNYTGLSKDVADKEISKSQKIKEKKAKEHVKRPIKFKSENERIKYMIRKVKEEGIDFDEDEEALYDD